MEVISLTLKAMKMVDNSENMLIVPNNCHRSQLKSVFPFYVCSTRNAAILALRTGDKQAALRHARRLKTLTISKKKCESFMDRIEEVLTFIVDAETTKKVFQIEYYIDCKFDYKIALIFSTSSCCKFSVVRKSCSVLPVKQVTDAVKVGAQAMKENHVTLDEVQICLEELDDAISQGRETQDALGMRIPKPLGSNETMNSHYLSLSRDELFPATLIMGNSMGSCIV